MIYILVLFGSLFVICAILGGRVLFRHRTVRKFVRGIRQRIHLAEGRGAFIVDETSITRPVKSPRTTAVELQKVRSFLREAEKAVAQGKTQEAEYLLIRALTSNPDAHDVRAELGKLYLKTNREKKAEAMYRELIQYRDDVSFYANLGLACYRQKKFPDACLAYREALDRDPKNPERSAALGRACVAAGRYKEATPLFESATARLPRDVPLLHLLAECYLQMHCDQEAQEAYQRINKLEPYNQEVKEKLQQLSHSS